MRKILFTIAVLGILLAMSCDETKEEVNPFVGTWVYIDNENARLVFSTSNVTMYDIDSIYWTGTYTYDEIKITITLDQELSAATMIESYGDTFIYSKYEFEDDLLILYNPAQFKFKKTL